MFDRKKFKASQVANLQIEDSKVDRLLGSGGGQSEFLKFDQGRNLFRLFPAHPDAPEGALFAESKVTTTLTVLQPEKDSDGNILKENGQPKMVEKIKNIFNAKVHGGYPFDLVDEYIKRVEEKASKLYGGDRAKRTDFLKYVYGLYFGKGNDKNMFGCNYSHKWVMYVKKFSDSSSSFEYGRLEIGKSVKNRINELSAIESENQAITTDPFTDPDTGIALSITYDANAKKSTDYYKTELYMPRRGGSTSIELFPLTDEDLTWLLEQDPLHKMYQNCFKRRDLDLQVEGLEILEKKAGYGVLAEDSFIDLIEEMYSLVPEDSDEPEKELVESGVELPKVEERREAPKVEKEVPKEEEKKEEPKEDSVEPLNEISATDRLAAMKKKLLGGE